MKTSSFFFPLLPVARLFLDGFFYLLPAEDDKGILKEFQVIAAKGECLCIGRHLHLSGGIKREPTERHGPERGPGIRDALPSTTGSQRGSD